jgi:hypothetical protein
MEPSIVEVLGVFGLRFEHFLTEYFVARPISCLSCLLLGPGNLGTDVLILVRSLPVCAFVELGDLLRHRLIELIQVDIAEYW